jgi:lysozyme
MNMQYSAAGMAMTKSFESCSLTAYHGAADPPGIWTIGWGHTKGVKEGDTCTQAQADQWALDDMQIVVNTINRDVTVQLTQGEFDALCDFGFNCGLHNLETSTLWADLQAGDYAGAAAQFPRWDHAAGKEVAGLLRRRLQEQAEFQNG